MIDLIVTHRILDNEIFHLSNENYRYLKLNTYNKFRLIFVDNASYPKYIPWLAYQPDIYIRNNKNLGNAIAWDEGMLMTTNDICIIMDNDVWVEKNWDREMVEKLSDNKIGVTFPYSKVGNQTEYRKRKDGFCFAFKKKLYSDIGSFLEEDMPFHSYYEDDNFYMKVMKKGLKLIASPTSRVWHCGQATSKKMWSKDFEKGIKLNEEWFNKKWNNEYPYLSS